MRYSNEIVQNNIELIVAGMKEKDEKSCEEFYETTYKPAYSVAYNITRNEDDALDILQDSYVVAYKKIDTLNQPEKAVPWFKMIVGNKCRDYLKKKKPTLFNELTTDDMEFEDILENENHEFIPEDVVDYSETKRLIGQILDELPEDQKLSVLMFYYDELTVKEIAESLGCSENTVKSRLNYARKKIKQEILILEKKGTKLYSAAPMPFITWMFKENEKSYVVSEALYGNIMAEVQVGVGAVTASSVASGAAGKTVAATVAVTAGKSAATKLVIGLIVATVAVGGTVASVKIFNKNTAENNAETTQVTTQQTEQTEPTEPITVEEPEKDTFIFESKMGYTVELPNIYKEKVIINEYDNYDEFCLKSLEGYDGGGFMFGITKMNVEELEDQNYIVNVEGEGLYVSDAIFGGVKNSDDYYVSTCASGWELMPEKYKDEYVEMAGYYQDIISTFQADDFVKGAKPEV